MCCAKGKQQFSHIGTFCIAVVQEHVVLIDVSITKKFGNGFSFVPSTMANYATYSDLPLLCLVVHIGTDLASILPIVVSPGMLRHKGVSSIFPINESGKPLE